MLGQLLMMDIAFIKGEIGKLNHNFDYMFANQQTADVGDDLLIPFPCKALDKFLHFNRELESNPEVKLQMVLDLF